MTAWLNANFSTDGTSSIYDSSIQPWPKQNSSGKLFDTPFWLYVEVVQSGELSIWPLKKYFSCSALISRDFAIVENESQTYYI